VYVLRLIPFADRRIVWCSSLGASQHWLFPIEKFLFVFENEASRNHTRVPHLNLPPHRYVRGVAGAAAASSSSGGAGRRWISITIRRYYACVSEWRMK
jgi:hypothetical protein